MENDDTDLGGEELSIDQAAAAYAKATAPEADKGQSDEDETEQGEQADDELQESEEEESESDGEDDPEGQVEEEDDGEPESDQGRFVAANGKVKMPDGSVSTIADLIAGNMKERDYRQKTMELAPQRRAIEEKSSALQALEQQANERLEYTAKLLESITPQPPDPELLQSDPLAYMQAKDQHERWAAHINYVQQTLAESKQKADDEGKSKRAEKAATEVGKLQEALKITDPAKLRAVGDEIMSAATAVGYTPDEVKESVPYDHRMALVLHKAAKWDKLQASKPRVQEKVKGRPPVTKGGKRLSPDAKRAQHASDAMNRLKETGTVEAATRAYLASRKG